MKFFFLIPIQKYGVLLGAFLLLGNLTAQAVEPPPRLQPDLVDEPPQGAAIDFEAYQRNIDDLYHIALMSSPNMDYGINNVIVNLNRKLAERPDDAEAMIGLGHVYRILGQPSEANRFYEKALSKDPGNFHLNIFTAITNVQEKDFEKALGLLKQASENNPLDIYPRIASGRILMIMKRYEEAAAHFEKVLELEPESREAAFAVSLAYQQIGQTDKAVQVLRDLQKKIPNDLYIRYHLGALSLMKGNITQTLHYWEELFHQGIRDIQFLFHLAIAYLEAGESLKSKKILEHLSFLFPRELDVELLTAEAYRQMNQLKEAERRYRLILAENPKYLSAYMGLADVLERQNRRGEAKEALSQAEQHAAELERLEADEQRIKTAQEDFMKHFVEA